LKRQKIGSNRYYTLLATDLLDRTESQPTQLVFFKHESPISLMSGASDFQVLFEQVKTSALDDVVLFHRVNAG
jgi:hypothetical protein